MLTVSKFLILSIWSNYTIHLHRGKNHYHCLWRHRLCFVFKYVSMRAFSDVVPERTTKTLWFKGTLCLCVCPVGVCVWSSTSRRDFSAAGHSCKGRCGIGSGWEEGSYCHQVVTAQRSFHVDRRTGFCTPWAGRRGFEEDYVGLSGATARTYSSSSTPTHVGHTGLPSIA